MNLFLRRKILSKAFNSHIVCYIVINNFFVSFEMCGGSYNPSQNTFETTKQINPSQNTFETTKQIRKMYPNFHEKFNC